MEYFNIDKINADPYTYYFAFVAEIKEITDRCDSNRVNKTISLCFRLTIDMTLQRCIAADIGSTDYDTNLDCTVTCNGPKHTRVIVPNGTVCYTPTAWLGKCKNGLCTNALDERCRNEDPGATHFNHINDCVVQCNGQNRLIIYRADGTWCNYKGYSGACRNGTCKLTDPLLIDCQGRAKGVTWYTTDNTCTVSCRAISGTTLTTYRAPKGSYCIKTDTGVNGECRNGSCYVAPPDLCPGGSLYQTWNEGCLYSCSGGSNVGTHPRSDGTACGKNIVQYYCQSGGCVTCPYSGTNGICD
uniref:Uncharacterized protein n=1 Tax=Plectus sambesii TaxID=2011161 RepID=A0A914VFS9_9BILA